MTICLCIILYHEENCSIKCAPPFNISDGNCNNDGCKPHNFILFALIFFGTISVNFEQLSVLEANLAHGSTKKKSTLSKQLYTSGYSHVRSYLKVV